MSTLNQSIPVSTNSDSIITRNAMSFLAFKAKSDQPLIDFLKGKQSGVFFPLGAMADSDRKYGRVSHKGVELLQQDAPDEQLQVAEVWNTATQNWDWTLMPTGGGREVLFRR